MTLKVFARTAGERHLAKMVQEPDGNNHGLVQLTHPKKGVIAIVCACGKVFWRHRKCILPTREEFDTDAAFVRAFRVACGIVTQDPGKRKARRVTRGKRPKATRNSNPKRWF